MNIFFSFVLKFIYIFFINYACIYFMSIFWFVNRQCVQTQQININDTSDSSLGTKNKPRLGLFQGEGQSSLSRNIVI